MDCETLKAWLSYIGTAVGAISILLTVGKWCRQVFSRLIALLNEKKQREQRQHNKLLELCWDLGMRQWQAPCNNSPVVLAERRQELARWTQSIQLYEEDTKPALDSELPVIFDDSTLAEAKLEQRRLQIEIQRFTLSLAKAKREGHYRDHSRFTLDPTKEDLGVPYDELPYHLRLWLDIKRE